MVNSMNLEGVKGGWRSVFLDLVSVKVFVSDSSTDGTCFQMEAFERRLGCLERPSPLTRCGSKSLRVC